MRTNGGGTASGALAILSWGSLGTLGAMSASMPPYLVLGSCFTIAATVGAIYCFVTRSRFAPLNASEVVIAALLLGLYHLVYFEAFHHAEAIPVSLINYLWPAWLIIIGNLFFRMSSGVPGYLGALLGFAGVATLIGGDLDLQFADVLGYGLAMLGAILWATYSNLRRSARYDGTGAMVSICILSAAFCFAIAILNGEAFMPSQQEMLVILLLGIGPAGGAFFLWDYGMRHGNAPLLGVLGYSAPIISTFLMIFAGMGEPAWRTWVAVGLVTFGGVIVHLGRKDASLTAA